MKKFWLLFSVVIVTGLLTIFYVRRPISSKKYTNTKSSYVVHKNPLVGKKFYIDPSRLVTKQAATYINDQNQADATLLLTVANQPGTSWLLGPTANDPLATKDIDTVARTSQEALNRSEVPIYQLYAIPGRDVCADLSKGGFSSSNDYLNWIDRILGSLKTQAVFSIEADAIAQTIRGSCMSPQQISDRYKLLQEVTIKLHQNPHVLASYLDAGHSEWFPDPSILVDPLQKSGVKNTQGIAVNVSYFVATPEISKWSIKLVKLLGNDKGIIIDTSRNGNGTAPATVTGDARWCNPVGRAIGQIPSTNVSSNHIDAFFWGKIIGESDGACFGNAPAGVFMPQAALELAKNATNP